MEKAVIYARVSSAEQEKHGFSIPAQLDLLRKYAKDNDFKVVEEFTEAETAKQAGRAEFNAMLKFLEKHIDVKNILVEKTDRLYRNLIDYAKLDCEAYNIYLVKENQILTPNSNCNDRFVHGMNVLMAKRFIDNLKEETQKGRKRKIEEDYFIGQVPYGYKKLNKNTTVFDEQKSKFVKRAFEIYASGDLSLKKVRKQLYDEGYIYKPSSDKITTGQLERILKNECYTGMLRYRGGLYQGKHPAIISSRLFAKVQIAFKKDNKPRTQKDHEFLYSGLIKCKNCGRAITCEIKRNKFIYYHCTGNYGKCENSKIYLREKIIDKQIENMFKDIVISDKLADYLNSTLDDSYKQSSIETKEKYDYLKREIAQIASRQEKLLDLYIDGNINKEKYAEKSSKYELQKERLKNQIKAFKSAKGNFINEGKKIIELAKHAYSLYSKQNIQEKKEMIKILLSNCTLDGEKLSYTYNPPFSFFAKLTKNNKKYARRDSNARPSA